MALADRHHVNLRASYAHQVAALAEECRQAMRRGPLQAVIASTLPAGTPSLPRGADPWHRVHNGPGNVEHHFIPVDFTAARFSYDGRRVKVHMEGRVVDSFEASPQAVGWAVRAYVQRRQTGMVGHGP